MLAIIQPNNKQEKKLIIINNNKEWWNLKALKIILLQIF